MTYNSKRNSSGAPVNGLCAAAFILFTFFYLFFFQADMLAMMQHVLSGGATSYNRTVGAILITLLLFMVQFGVRRLAGLNGVFTALTYFPSLVLLTLLTGVGNDFDVDRSFGPWLWLTVPLILLFAWVVYVLRKNGLTGSGHYFRNTFPGVLWINIVTLALQFLMVCGGGNTDEVFHYRIRMENLLANGEYDKALEVGEKSLSTDESLTMLRVFALSRTKQLGDRLFEYPVVGGSKALLPDGKTVKCTLLPADNILRNLGIRRKGNMDAMTYLLYLESNGLAMKSVTDYILCGYLLDCDLDNFVREVMKKYNITSPTLPKYYRQALTLYTHLRANPAVVYHSEVLDADYADFQALEKQYKNQAERASYVRDTYGDTYWYYYFYNANKPHEGAE